MAKKSEKINAVISGLLENNEQIRAVGQLSSGLGVFGAQFWYVAITNKR